MDVPGNDLGCLQASSKICQIACNANPDCKSYNGFKSGDGKDQCCFKSTNTNPIAMNGITFFSKK